MDEQPNEINETAPPAERVYVRALVYKRIINHIIDVFLFYMIVLSGIRSILSNMNFTVQDDDYYSNIRDLSEGFVIGDVFNYYVLPALFYAIYMGLLETFMNGRSIGKLITGTRAINTDGSELVTLQAFGRGVIRTFPFEFISYFGKTCDPWHDRWTQSMVIDEKLSGLEAA